MPHIASLRLTNFRSYNSLDFNFDGRPVILTGDNGAGKTNLLEAISLLTPGRGLRRARLDTLRRHEDGANQDPNSAAIWAVAAKVTGEDIGTVNIGVGQLPDAPGRRAVRVDGKPATGTQLAQLLTVMWLIPAQDRLFTGPASGRRQFLDRLCLAHAPTHGTSSIRYEKARTERNRLLSEGNNDALWYEALEADMALFGAHIAQARALTVAALISEINSRPEGSFPKAKLALDGEAEALFEGGAELDDVEHYIREALAGDRRIDLRASRTLRGVHKTEFLVLHSAKNMPAANCSTGEQKALLIGLILAQARAQSSRGPILLLDEVAAHLDAARRAALAEELIDLGTQVFMTGTDVSLFSAFKGRAQFLTVGMGDIKPSAE